VAFVLDLGGAVPSAIDDLVSEIVENFAAAMIDPAKFGGVRTSPKSFRRQVVLPTLELGPRVEGIATRLLWKSLIATADGLFLSGPVSLLSDPGRDPLGFGAKAFGVPRGTVLASDRGCVFGWQGDPPSDLWVTGSVSLGGGTLCGFTLLPPHEGLSPYVEVEDWSAESHTVRVKLPLAVSRTVVGPVRMLVRSSRGVRLADPTVVRIVQSEERYSLGLSSDTHRTTTRPPTTEPGAARTAYKPRPPRPGSPRRPPPQRPGHSVETELVALDVLHHEARLVVAIGRQ
jgi:hypothetical protein